jgi:hypothetical protein
MAAGYILQGDLSARGVPSELHGGVVELKHRYSTSWPPTLSRIA